MHKYTDIQQKKLFFLPQQIWWEKLPLDGPMILNQNGQSSQQSVRINYICFVRAPKTVEKLGGIFIRRETPNSHFLLTHLTREPLSF